MWFTLFCNFSGFQTTLQKFSGFRQHFRNFLVPDNISEIFWFQNAFKIFLDFFQFREALLEIFPFFQIIFQNIFQIIFQIIFPNNIFLGFRNYLVSETTCWKKKIPTSVPEVLFLKDPERKQTFRFPGQFFRIILFPLWKH